MEILHPFLSIFDLLLLSQTWKAGLEYGIRIGKSQTQEGPYKSPAAKEYD